MQRKMLQEIAHIERLISERGFESAIEVICHE